MSYKYKVNSFVQFKLIKFLTLIKPIREINSITPCSLQIPESSNLVCSICLLNKYID